MGIESIVNVSIVRGSRTVTRAGFGVPLILGPNAAFVGIRSYASLAEVAVDFTTGQDEYKIAEALFSQNPKPRKIKIAVTSTPVAQVETLTPTVLNSTLYTVTIDGVAYQFTSDVDATANEIVAGLLALINADTNAKVTASGTTTLIITADNAGEAFSISAGSNLAIAHTTANNGIATDILDYANVDVDWYFLHTTANDAVTVKEAAATIETLRKMYFFRDNAAGIKTNSTTDIVSFLKGKSYMRTAFMWNDVSAEKAEAALVGAIATFDPGSYTAAFKALVGVTPAVLTTSEQGFLDGKNANYYVEIAGVSVVRNGKTVGGEYIDVVQFSDWLQARIEETIFSRLVNSKKIPYTDAGVAIIEADLRAVLLEGIRVGGLTNDPEPTVTVPKVADVSSIDRAARLLPDVAFGANLAGAIHAVEINGIISV
jgi:hypothetical protein